MVQQRKIEKPSISFIQAFEVIFEAKCAQYSDNLGSLAHALTAMTKLYQLTKRSKDGAMISKNIILTMVDQLLNEILIMVADDEDCSI